MFQCWWRQFSRQLYYPSDVKDIVSYGYQRGILVLPEFDAPAHAVAGWQWGKEAGLGDLVVCDQKMWANSSTKLAASPNAGQLNPINDNVYQVYIIVYSYWQMNVLIS